MKILLMGPPACGKGTQGALLSEYLRIPIISVGQLLRNVPETHPHYSEIHKYMDTGALVNEGIASTLLKERLHASDCVNGYILDGWGRKAEDLEAFDPGFDVVILINIPRDEVLRRITGRRTCTTDGKIYNINTLPEEELAKCTGELVQRPDDTEEVVNNRLDIYEQETKQTIDKFKSQGLLLDIDGTKTPDKVFEDLISMLRQSRL